MKKLAVKALPLVMGIVLMVGITMLDGRLWYIGGLMMIASGSYLAVIAKAKGLMKICEEAE